MSRLLHCFQSQDSETNSAPQMLYQFPSQATRQSGACRHGNVVMEARTKEVRHRVFTRKRDITREALRIIDAKLEEDAVRCRYVDEAKVGQEVIGKVTRKQLGGVFLNAGFVTDSFLPESKMPAGKKPAEFNIGDEIKVKVEKAHPWNNEVFVTCKEVCKPVASYKEGDEIEGIVEGFANKRGVYLDIGAERSAFLSKYEIEEEKVPNVGSRFKVGEKKKLENRQDRQEEEAALGEYQSIGEGGRTRGRKSRGNSIGGLEHDVK